MAIEIKIDGYDSFEQIAVGGMAAVYRARKVSIDKTVAIKVLFPYLANDESFIERFQREAKSAAKIQHENIVNVVDFGGSDGCYYIVMEFYEGLTIAELLRREERVPLDIATSIIFDVSLGLEAAHSQGIVHRDVKPANIIFTDQGGIKIADFGLAKRSDTITVVTQPGKVLGTPAYMSPEQAAGDDVGPQSDIFSLGVVAYELFCQKRPFEGGSYSEVIEKIQTHEPRALSMENPLIQPSIEAVVRKMLEKDVARRYQSASDLIADLEKAMEKLDIKRDRRHLQKYIQDPEGYATAFTEKMLARCLSQGTYYMQKGKSHIAEAVLEFKRILYLDPSNERARVYLSEIASQERTGDATVTLEVPPEPRSGKPARHVGGHGARPKGEATAARASGRGGPAPKARRPRAAWLSMGALLLIGGVASGYWGWTASRTQRADSVPPMITAPERHTAAEGDEVRFTVQLAARAGETVRVYGENLPRGATLTPDGAFTWPVDYDQAGLYTIDFHADNGTTIQSARTVIDVADTPSGVEFADPGRVRVQSGERLAVKLRASSTIERPVRFDLDSAPAGMRLEGDEVVWAPAKGQTGEFRVRIRGTDGVADAEQTLVVEVAPPSQPVVRQPASGRLEWILPAPANIYVDGALEVRGGTRLSIELPEGRHRVRAELLDGVTSFEEVVSLRGGGRTVLDPPTIAYGKLSVYFLGGVGELWIDGRKFPEQPPFTTARVAAGRHRVSCVMFRSEDSREFEVTVIEGVNTVIEYEVGKDPVVSYDTLAD